MDTIWTSTFSTLWQMILSDLLALLILQLQMFILGDAIKLDQVWWQNHDLHWILLPKMHLKFIGVSYFWRTGPQKSWLLAGPTLTAYKDGHSTRPVGGISKKAYVLHTYCSSAMEQHSQHVSSRPIPTPAVLNAKTPKKCFFASFGTVFNQMVGASRLLTWDVIKPVNTPVPLQNWNST